MAKTKPIGVRFDEDLLIELKEHGRAESPQKALNYLSDFYRHNGKDKDWLKNFVKVKVEEKIKPVVNSNDAQIAEYEKEIAGLGTSGLAVMRKKFLLKQIAYLKNKP
tara:strand:- start:41 stop:361 length:321 start_codon:yes stop_codon:yes gene_type:complete